MPGHDAQIERVQAALVDRYQIERELGTGGMATVYLAHDLKLKRSVAIKVLHPELAATLGPDRFLREVEIVANFHHPHIVAVHDSGEADGLLYYVMPFVEGEPLRERLNREKQLPLDDALQIVREVADGLSYAHERGVIHRDVKPENILLESGHAMLADFGIARAISAAGGARLTETGIAIGTPAYISPEQAAGSRDLDQRTDVYSLACVVYEMLAGEPPFTGPTAESVLRQHLTADPPSINAMRGGVPSPVATGLLRGLAKVPADRFDSVRQLVQVLEQPVAREQPLRPAWTRALLLATAGAFAFGGLVFMVSRWTVPADNSHAPGPEAAATTPSPQANAPAYRAFLSGRAAIRARNPEAGLRAIEHFREAIMLDPGFATAHAALAHGYALADHWGWDVPGVPRDSLQVLRLQEAELALSLDSTSADSWLAMGMALREQDPERALRHHRRAVALDPASIEARYQLGFGFFAARNLDSAIAVMQQVTLRDPFYAYAYGGLAQMQLIAGRPVEALESATRGIAVDSLHAPLYWMLADAHLRLRQPRAARVAAARAIALGLAPAGMLALDALAALHEGDSAAGHAALENAATELRRKFARAPGGLPNFEAGLLSGVYAQLGEQDSALAWFERVSPGHRRFYALQFERHWLWEPMRRNPGFRSLLAMNSK